MNEMALVVAEIIVGIALLGVLAAVVTAVMVPRLSRITPADRPTPESILAERYARGELTREQLAQMRQDLGLSAR